MAWATSTQLVKAVLAVQNDIITMRRSLCSNHRQTRGRRATKPRTEPTNIHRCNISACTATEAPTWRRRTLPTEPAPQPVQPLSSGQPHCARPGLPFAPQPHPPPGVGAGQIRLFQAPSAAACQTSRRATKCGHLNNGDGCGGCSHRLLRHAGRDHNGPDQAVLGHGVLMLGHGNFRCRTCVTTWPGQHDTAGHSHANPRHLEQHINPNSLCMRACMHADSGAYFPTISARYPLVHTTSSDTSMSWRGTSWWHGSRYFLTMTCSGSPGRTYLRLLNGNNTPGPAEPHTMSR